MSYYQRDYKYNGCASYLEFYLFINPLGGKCYYCEREMMETVNQIAANIDIHFLPYHNHNIVTDFLQRNQLPVNDNYMRNLAYCKIYQSALAFKAATMQGKAYGRRYLFALQQAILGQIDHFNDQLVYRLVKEIGLDLNTFKSDYESDLVRKLYIKDQQIAKDMGVTTTPSLVIFNHNTDSEGILIQNEITQSTIFNALDKLLADEYHRNSIIQETHPANDLHLTLLTKNYND